MQTPQAAQWQAACEAEVASLDENNTWILVDRTALPSDANLIYGRWVFTLKLDTDGSIDVQWIATTDQKADGLTKALDRIKHSAFVKQLNLVDCSHHIQKQKHASVNVRY